MKRRTMLKALAGGLCLPSLARERSKPMNKFAKRGTTRKLLVIFQRGGNDGLNTLIPVQSTQYAHYQNLRPDLALSQSDMFDVQGSGFFRMHQAMGAIRPVMNNGRFSWIHAVGYPNPNRSHFESQAYYETGVPGNGLAEGWINRYLAHTSGAGLIRGVSVAWSIPQMVTGQVAVPVSTNFGRFEIAADDNLDDPGKDNYRALLEQVMNGTPTTGNSQLYDTGDKIFDMVSSFADRDANNYTPENSAVYPNTTFGRRMAHAAQMLKDDPSYLGIEVCTVDQGGYDNHANQVTANNTAGLNTTHGNLLSQLAEGLNAFYTDMGNARMQDTLVLVVSEFGRRAYQNDSFGTDHGTGSLVMVMGNSVSGVPHNDGGRWPGLAPGDLFEGGDLDWVTDYRDIYWEILSQHMGVDDATLAQIIPGHTYTPVGFL